MNAAIKALQEAADTSDTRKRCYRLKLSASLLFSSTSSTQGWIGGLAPLPYLRRAHRQPVEKVPCGEDGAENLRENKKKVKITAELTTTVVTGSKQTSQQAAAAPAVET